MASLAAVAMLSLPVGCAMRDDAYRFRAPVVSSVRAAELPPRTVAGSRETTQHEARTRAQAPVTMDGPASHRDTTSPRASELHTQQPLAAALLSLVGDRDKEATQIRFVWNALDTLGSPVDSQLRAVSKVSTLVALARERGAFTTQGEPLLGDLLVFDAVLRGNQPMRIGVVVGSRGDGTIEFVYLARNVVRRGFLNRAQPHFKRDPQGRSINTIMRQKYGNGAKGRGDLTGDLHIGFLRLERLAPR